VDQDSLRPTIVEVSLARLADNIHAIRAALSPAAVMPIVKTNAYGYGLVPVARHLASLGATTFGVAFLEEAVALRGTGITQLLRQPAPRTRSLSAMARRGYDLQLTRYREEGWCVTFYPRRPGGTRSRRQSGRRGSGSRGLRCSGQRGRAC